MDLTKRSLLVNTGPTAVGVAVAALFGATIRGAFATETPPHKFEVAMSDDDWKKKLTPNEYSILRKEGTERPFSSPLNNEHRAGVFACAGCGLDAFSSKTKFDSGTGWPSFWQPLPMAVEQSRDASLGMVRDEIHCRRCGGHLGHVFDDGPKPTGLRYCMNGFAMHFTPAAA
jgi:peptide-methionine (R)-S-oxide reductase